MKLSPWFNIGKDGPPVRSGVYRFEIFLPDTVITLKGLYIQNDNKIITEDGRFIGLAYEDHWQGVLK